MRTKGLSQHAKPVNLGINVSIKFAENQNDQHVNHVEKLKMQNRTQQGSGPCQDAHPL
jgi:hypothetical protein